MSSDSHSLSKGSALDLGLLAACLFILTYGLWQYGLYEPHEGHFAGVGREMLLSGNWVVPTLNGSPYLNKPPLMYWSIAVSNSLFGISEGSSRMAAAFYGWCGVLVAWVWAGKLWGLQAARLAAMFLTVSVGWFLFTHQVMIDVLLASLNFLSLFLLWRCLEDPTRKKPWLLFWISLSLALLAKGPPGVAFPLLAMFGTMALDRRWSLLRQCGLWWGLPLLFLPTSIWAFEVETQNRGFLDHVLVNEIWNRLLNKRWPPDYKVSEVSVFGYLLVSAVWCAPWSLLLPQISSFALREIRRSPTEPTGISPDSTRPNRQRQAVLILLLGAIMPIAIFLPVSSRLIYYSLPALPPVAMLAAGWWASAGLAGRTDKHVRNAGILFALIGAVTISAGFWVVPQIKNIPELAISPQTLTHVPGMAWMLGAGIFSGGILMLFGRPGWAGLILFFFLGLGITQAGAGFDDFEDVRSSRNLVRKLDARLGMDAVWVSEGSFEMGASAGIAYYLALKDGKPRFVRVMDDDDRRTQPSFGKAPRLYPMLQPELADLWKSESPVVYITDLMRRDWEKDPPNLPPNAGEPVKEFETGFRKVYLNNAARKKLGLPLIDRESPAQFWPRIPKPDWAK